MAITTYDELQSAVSNFLEASALDADRINEFIALAEARIQRLDLRQLEATLSDTTSSGVISVPSDYQRLKHIYITTSGKNIPLQRQDPEYILARYPTRSATGRPRVVGRQGSNFIFGPYPDSDYTIGGVYYTTLQLTGASPTNDVLSAHPDIYLYGALVASTAYLGEDERLQVWRTFYDEAVMEAKSEVKREMSSGSVPQMQFA